MEKSWMQVTWQVMLARGVVAALFGIVAIAWPISTAITLVVLWGVWALVDGISALAQALQPGPGAARAVLALTGAVALGAAFFALFRPVAAAVTLTWILGVWLIARGALGIVLTFTTASNPLRWLSFAGSALDVVLGVLFATNPGRSAVNIAALLGVIALLWGLVYIVLGLMLRKEVTVVEGPQSVTS